MPKLKSHSGTKDRVRVTKNGKALIRKNGGNHFLEHKSKSRKRTYAGLQEVTGKIKKNLKQKLGV
ncbi:50S ribosomal protein L35 [Candidatus Saccharibacteria bacterium]|jgi:large subunit ribosomal protein L35|nr:50S ribosomal protein L35 [Candidatus Saccharibacteria bacterium]MBP7834707.1 50S ribosomal protein L35 [Candidatus Saccharibacteria bacterium]